MSAQQVEEQYDEQAGGPRSFAEQVVEPVAPAETPAPVEVRRNAGVGAVIGVAAAAVGIGWLARAAGSGSLLDWAVCLLMGVLAVVFLRSLFDARTPMLVIDELGVRVRLAHHWRGFPWDAVETVSVQPRRGLLRDGRIVIELHSVQRALEGLDAPARRQAALNRKLYGATLAVPLGLATRVSGARVDEVADRVTALSEGRAEVVTLVPARATEAAGSTTETYAEPTHAEPTYAEPTYAEPTYAGLPVPGRAALDDVEEDAGPVELAEHPAEPPVVADRPAARGGSGRVVRWLRRSPRPGLEEDPDAGPTDGEGLEVAPATSTRAPHEAGEPGAVHQPGAARDGLDSEDDGEREAPVALRRIGEVTTAMTSAVTSAVTGAVTEAVSKAVAPVHERDASDAKVRAISRLGDPVAPLVIDDFRPEPAYDPVIGPELAAARTRVGLSVDELADRTRIRPHVIESIEVDDFAACGGDFYARGHIRTLARVLGKDPAPMLEQFEQRYASAPVNARTVFEAELSTGMVGSLRRGPGGPNWALLVGAVLALVLVWSLVRLLAGPGETVLEDPPPMLNGSGGIGASYQAPEPATAPDPVVTTLTAVGGGTSVVVRDGQDTVVFRGDLALGEVERLEVEPPVTVVADDGSVLSVAVAGRDVGLLGQAAEPTTRTYRVPAR